LIGIDDGIARFDLQRNSAIHYLLSDDNKPVEVFAIGIFDGQFYAAAQNGLVTIDIATP